MVGLDTNVLVRYLTQDGEEAPAVTRFLETTCTEQSPGFLCMIVLCELVWVLDRAYGYDRRSIVLILERLLSTREFEIENAQAVWRALGDYETGPADFADYLISYVCREHEAGPVYTLDRKAAKHKGFALLP